MKKKTPKPTPPASHTPEPWSVHQNVGRKGELGVIADKAPCVIAHGFSEKHWPEVAEANARRIVACVNACAGIPTEALEGRNLRDVVEALLWATDHITEKPAEPTTGLCIISARQMARAILTKFEGK